MSARWKHWTWKRMAWAGLLLLAIWQCLYLDAKIDTSLPAVVGTQDANGIIWEYRVYDRKAEICSAVIPTDAIGCITMPSTLGGYPVMTIGEGVFCGCSGLTSVVIPDSVTNIGHGAFAGCSSLASVTIPDGVTSVGECAFAGCGSLAHVRVPVNVSRIGRFVFCDCGNLRKAVLPESLRGVVNETKLFAGCADGLEVEYEECPGRFSGGVECVSFSDTQCPLCNSNVTHGVCCTSGNKYGDYIEKINKGKYWSHGGEPSFNRRLLEAELGDDEQIAYLDKYYNKRGMEILDWAQVNAVRDLE